MVWELSTNAWYKKNLVLKKYICRTPRSPHRESDQYDGSKALAHFFGALLVHLLVLSQRRVALVVLDRKERRERSTGLETSASPTEDVQEHKTKIEKNKK